VAGPPDDARLCGTSTRVAFEKNRVGLRIVVTAVTAVTIFILQRVGDDGSAWGRTWLACSTRVYVDMNLLGESAGEENE
jgi:hypothetical protein